MTNNAHRDHITGLSFATTYAAFLKVGESYAPTFDATPRKVVKIVEHPTKRDMMAIVWDNTTPGKMAVVPMNKRYFNR